MGFAGEVKKHTSHDSFKYGNETVHLDVSEGLSHIGHKVSYEAEKEITKQEIHDLVTGKLARTCPGSYQIVKIEKKTKADKDRHVVVIFELRIDYGFDLCLVFFSILMGN